MVLFQASKIADAINLGNTDRLRELLAKGANPEAHSELSRRPLERAVWCGNKEAVAVLLEYNAKNDTNYYNGPLLHLAASYGYVEIAQMLIDHWPDILKKEDYRFNTALHVASEAGHVDMVTFLIDRGIDPAIKNLENRTALFMAEKNKHQDVVVILQAYQEQVPPSKLPMPKQLAQASVVAADDREGWHVLADDRIAHVRIEKPLGYKITEIFNFAGRERTTLHQNMATKAETALMHSFDDIAEKTGLEQALLELKKRGGKPDAGSISGLRKP
jgi:ankyrin repeat protein